MIIVVGDGGKAAWTANGTRWSSMSVSPFGTSNIRGIAFGTVSVGDRWVAVGYDGKIATSTTGTTWTAVTNTPFGTRSINSVTYGNGRFVAVADGGIICYSTNGTTWTLATSAPATTQQLLCVTLINNRFVAVGGSTVAVNEAAGTSGTTANQTTTSAGAGTGINWSFVRGTGLSISVRGLAYGNNRYVIGGSGGGITGFYYSTDARNWERVDNHPFASINGLAFGGGTFIAVGGQGKMARSTDGVTWTAVTNPFGTTNINDVVFSNNMFVAVGAGGRIIYAQANNPTTWTNVANTTFGTTAIRGIANNGNTWIAVGDDGKMAISTNNCSTWTTVNSGTRVRINSITFGNGRWVVATNDSIRSSTNGTTWSSNYTTDDNGFNNVYFGNGRFLAGGMANGLIMYSTDGVTWRAANDVSREINNADGSLIEEHKGDGFLKYSFVQYYRFLWQNGSFMAGGSEGTVLSSY
jgi:hypothetical protein